MTRSAVEPKTSLLVPPRPCEPITMRSAPARAAVFRISVAASPVTMWIAGSTRWLCAGTRPSISVSAASTWSRSVPAWPAAAAPATSSGSFTETTVRRAGNAPASATAWRNARSAWTEKSTGQRIDEGRAIRFGRPRG